MNTRTHIMRHAEAGAPLCGTEGVAVVDSIPLALAAVYYEQGVLGREVQCLECLAAVRRMIEGAIVLDHEVPPGTAVPAQPTTYTARQLTGYDEA